MIKKRQRMIPMKQNSESNENVCPGYYYYDSKLAITPEELQDSLQVYTLGQEPLT